jgi:putative sterol carrier protein
MAEKRAKRKHRLNKPAKEQDPDTITEEAKRLTKNLIERFDASKAKDWEAMITIRLKQAGGRPDLSYWLTIANQTVRLEQENPHRQANLDIQVAVQTWVAILTKEKTVEEAFAGGELLLDGKIEHGLKLTEVFSI